MKKKILSLLTMLCMVAVLLPVNMITVSAYTGTKYGDYLYYSKSSDSVTITDCDSAATEIVIPSEIDGSPVTTIENYVFAECSGLTSVTIPSSVTSIGNDAFDWCSGLTSINVDENNSNYCSLDGNLFNKSKTELIQYAIGKADTQYTIPDSVTTIGYFAFSHCSSLTSVTIPQSVTFITLCAFSDCDGLTSVTIPGSVTFIGDCAFSDCDRLTSINVDKNNAHYCSVDGNLFNKAKTRLIQYSIGKTDTQYTIPNSITTIGDAAFSGCIGLTSVTIPDSVTTIGEWTFYDCKSLTSVTIPDNVTSIGNSAFGGCIGLTSVTIPNSVTTIGDSAFRWCSGLTSVTIPNSITSIGDRVFAWCSELTSVTIPDSVTTIGDGAFSDCDKLTNVYYYGTEANWNNIAISDGNASLNNAEITYLKCTQTTVSTDGKSFSVKPINIANGNTVILALYNGDTLAEMQSAVYNGDDIPFTTDKTYTNARVMAWDSLSGLKPACEVEIVK